MLQDALKTEILTVLFSKLEKEKYTIFLYGSFAQGTEKRVSDIDIGILGDEPVEYGIMGTLKEKLDEEVKTLRKIDLVDFRRVKNQVFLKNVLKEAVVWYQGKECKISLEALIKRISS